VAIRCWREHPRRSKRPTTMVSFGVYPGPFNDTFKTGLNGTKVKVSDLLPGDRIADRLSRYLASENERLKQNGGFNPCGVASHLVNHPLVPSKLNATTLGNFGSVSLRIRSESSTDWYCCFSEVAKLRCVLLIGGPC
jgi:hypothetical protein